MTSLLLSALATVLTVSAAPALSADVARGDRIAGLSAFLTSEARADQFDRRCRGRAGRDASQDVGTGQGGHGRRPRNPGGSGCDDPHDVLEHPECRG